MVSIGVLAPPLNSRFQIKKDIFRPTFNLQSQTKLVKQCQKIKQNLTRKETLVSAFVLFFTTSTKKNFLEGRLGTINETMSKN